MSSKTAPKPVSLRASMRHEAISAALESRGQVSVSDLADRLGVTAVTIREDLKHLENRGLLTRTRGGALAKPKSFSEPALERASEAQRPEKQAIARFAAKMVKSGQTIFLDVGSTTTALAHALPMSLQNLVVVTNGLNIALALEQHPGVSVMVTGGKLRPLQHSLVAPMATLLLERLQADIAFIGCNGVDLARGFSNTNIAEAEIKQAMLRSANFAVFLADHTKIGRVASAFVARIEDADLLITDRGADPEILDELGDRGLRVDVVEPT